MIAPLQFRNAAKRRTGHRLLFEFSELAFDQVQQLALVGMKCGTGDGRSPRGWSRGVINEGIVAREIVSEAAQEPRELPVRVRG
ncbi:MAG: hypothetical protein NDI75_07295 [Candidatus Didemnitutus sp.]|nr:hypothetical protein [Candidatus Didemnitutus sp.]